MDGDQFRPCAAAGQSYPDLEKGEHTFAVRATDAAGTADPTPATHAWTIDAAAPRTADTMPTSRALGVATTTETGVTFGANADARVARAYREELWHGKKTHHRSRARDRELFTLRGERRRRHGNSSQSAAVRPGGDGQGPAVFPAGNAWTEGSITWNSRPERTSTVAADDKGPIASNTWVTFDVTSLVAGDGTYTFNLASTSRDAVYFHSKEAADASLRPRLVLTVDATAPADTTAPTVTDTTPTDGAADVAVTTGVEVVFSEPMAPATLTTGTFTLQPQDGAAITAQVSLNAAGTTATLDPDADLDAATTYTATVEGGQTEPRTWRETRWPPATSGASRRRLRSTRPRPRPRSTRRRVTRPRAAGPVRLCRRRVRRHLRMQARRRPLRKLREPEDLRQPGRWWSHLRRPRHRRVGEHGSTPATHAWTRRRHRARDDDRRWTGRDDCQHRSHLRVRLKRGRRLLRLRARWRGLRGLFLPHAVPGLGRRGAHLRGAGHGRGWQRRPDAGDPYLDRRRYRPHSHEHAARGRRRRRGRDCLRHRDLLRGNGPGHPDRDDLHAGRARRR